jgi:hypothetical protein
MPTRPRLPSHHRAPHRRSMTTSPSITLGYFLSRRTSSPGSTANTSGTSPCHSRLLAPAPPPRPRDRGPGRPAPQSGHRAEQRRPRRVAPVRPAGVRRPDARPGQGPLRGRPPRVAPCSRYARHTSDTASRDRRDIYGRDIQTTPCGTSAPQAPPRLGVVNLETGDTDGPR